MMQTGECCYCGNKINTCISTAINLCINCTSEIFPFNYIDDDDDFQRTMFIYFHSNLVTDYKKLQRLCINPFNLNTIQFNSLDYDTEETAHVPHSCKYMFCEDFKTKFCNTNSSLSMIHVNARSLKNKFEDFQLMLSTLGHTFSIIGVSETWFNEHTNLNLFHLDNYSLYNLDRTDKTGGGVALYVKDGIKCSQRKDLSIITSDYEMIFIELETTKKHAVFGCVYRPPNVDIPCFKDRIDDVLKTLESEKKDIYIMGDYNINFINYATHCQTGDFLDNMYLYNMFPLITKPTRISPQVSS